MLAPRLLDSILVTLLVRNPHREHCSGAKGSAVRGTNGVGLRFMGGWGFADVAGSEGLVNLGHKRCKQTTTH